MALVQLIWSLCGFWRSRVRQHRCDRYSTQPFTAQCHHPGI